MACSDDFHADDELGAHHADDELCALAALGPLGARTPEELFARVREALGALVAHGDAFVVFEVEPVHRYVQALVTGGVLQVESVSNRSLGRECAAEHGLRSADRGALRRLGLAAPDRTNPNWHRDLGCTPGDVAVAAEVLTAALVAVHHADPADVVAFADHAAPVDRRPVGS